MKITLRESVKGLLKENQKLRHKYRQLLSRFNTATRLGLKAATQAAEDKAKLLRAQDEALKFLKQRNAIPRWVRRICGVEE